MVSDRDGFDVMKLDYGSGDRRQWVMKAAEGRGSVPSGGSGQESSVAARVLEGTRRARPSRILGCSTSEYLRSSAYMAS